MAPKLKVKIEAYNIPAGVQPLIALFADTNGNGFSDKSHDGVALIRSSFTTWEGKIALEKESPKGLELGIVLGIGKGAAWALEVYGPGSLIAFFKCEGPKLKYSDTTQAFVTIDKDLK